MNEPEIYSLLAVIGHLTIQVALVLRALMRPHREPASRIAWVLVILVFPVLGILAYLLLGETNIGRRRGERLRQTLARLPGPGLLVGARQGRIAGQYRAVGRPD
ncbi:MAG: PLDc N-terminal domain-containing protein, partial [Chromatiaceae bacterium]